jgi:signal transduction histidine kinase
VVSETLAGLAGQAEATWATITVAREDDAVVAEVVHDGVARAALPNGSGVRHLAERVEALSSRLDVDSRPGGGTRLRAVVPAQPPARSNGHDSL